MNSPDRQEPCEGASFAELLLSVAEGIQDLLCAIRPSGSTIKPLSARAQLRVDLGRDAVISVTEAAKWLPFGDGETQWMVDAGITFQRGRYRYVLWSDVLDALPPRDRPKKSPRRRTGSRVGGAASGKVKASDLPRFSRG